MLATKIVSEDGISYNLTPLGYVVLIAVVIVVLAVGFIVKDKKTHSVKRLVTSAMAIALATLTSFITIFKMPMGGSVTLFSMLFIVLIGYWYGISAGMTDSISGWIFFAVYTPEFFNSAVLYSLAYNAAYIGAEGIITIIVIMLPPVKKAILYVKQTSNE